MLLIKPYLGCNISCKYCYEKPYRENHDTKMQYDLDLVIKTMEELYKSGLGQATPCLHGGEILCLPKKDVETLLKRIFELSGQTSIQTNATKIDDDFVEMFKKYKTCVGISWDGPGDLSSFRPGTSNVGDTMKRLVKEGVSVANIIVVSKANAGTPEKRAKLKKWLLELKKMGIQGGRVNPCNSSPKNELSTKDFKDFYLDLADFLIKNDMKWSPFVDIINGLKQRGRVCVLSSCDFFNTPSATVILGDGTVTSCIRTSSEHVLWSDGENYKTREEILRQVPQEHGGCKDCRFFPSCYGGCPSTAIDKDWRNRTYLCGLWKGLFEYYERIFNHLEIPILEKGSTSCGAGEGRGYTDGGHYDALHGDHFDSQEEEGRGKVQNHTGGGRGYTDGGHYDALHGDHFDSQEGEERRKNQDHKGVKHLDSHGDAPHLDYSDGGLEPKDDRHQDDAFIYNDSGHNDASHGDHFDSDNF